MSDETLRKILERKLKHAKPQYEALQNRGRDHLSVYGFEDMGYFKGIITTCEDLLDALDEMEKET